MANSSTTNISIRMDKTLKAEAEKLYSDLGMNLSTAFNISSVVGTILYAAFLIYLLNCNPRFHTQHPR